MHLERHVDQQSADVGTPALPPIPTGGAFVFFALLGSGQALYGSLLPEMRASFHIGSASAGLILSAYFFGAVCGTLVPLVIGTTLSLRSRVMAASGLVGLGSLGLAASYQWGLALAATGLSGIGDGVLVVTFNAIFSTGFGTRSSAMTNLLNAAFGGGAILGPLLTGLLLGANFRVAFVVLGILIIALAPSAWQARDNHGTAPIGPMSDSATPLRILLVLLLFFALYEGLEADIAGWEATHLVAQGFSASAATTATAFFWAAMTLGRILLAPLSVRYPPDRMIPVSLAAMMMLVLTAYLPGFAFEAYTLSGAALATVFPMGFIWMRQMLPSSRNAPTFIILAALVGGVIFPIVVGRAISLTSPTILPAILSAIAVTCLGVTLRLQHMGA